MIGYVGFDGTQVFCVCCNQAWGPLTLGASYEGDYTANALYETVRWALKLMRERPSDFRQVVRTAMAQDWSWDRSAAEYEALYRKVMGSPGGRP